MATAVATLVGRLIELAKFALETGATREVNERLEQLELEIGQAERAHEQGRSM
jgi:hypothetical protein